MAVKRLTKRSVEALRASQTPFLVWDEGLPGFGVKMTPAGRRVYVVQYRLPGQGRRSPAKRLTLGAHGTLTVDEARKRARKVLARVTEGHDPAQQRADAKQAPTVADVAPLFLSDVEGRRKATTAYEYARHFTTKGRRGGSKLRGEVITHFGRLKVRDVSHTHVAAFHDRFRNRPYAGNRLLALLSTFFTWCERRGYREVGTNPCRGVERYREKKRERFLSVDELKRLGEALRSAEKDGANPVAIRVLRFLTLSGYRESEALSLRWSAVDFDREAVTLDESKTGRSVRPLGKAAAALLREIPREADNNHVFPGREPGTHLVEIKKVWQSVRCAAQLEDIRLHDLRHSVASIAASGGASLPLIGALLGHQDVKSTQRYAHLTDDSRKLLADKTSQEIANALAGRSTPVTPLRSAR